MKETIRARLSGSGPARDPDAEARAFFGPGIAAALFPQPLVPAAVLLPLVERESGLALLLTRRTEHLRDHPGQISFPGGRLDAGDAGPLAAALRETTEEIGIPADAIEVAGYLPAQPVITGFAITPVVGFIDAGASLQPDPFEVAEVLDVPLGFLLEPANLVRATRWVQGGVEIPTVEIHYGGHRIWGATANIIFQFISILK